MESGSSSAADDHWSITKLVSTTPVQDETESSNNNSGNQRLTFESDFALNHRALVEHTQNELRRLFENDSLLRDLPFDVTHDEVAAQVIFVWLLPDLTNSRATRRCRSRFGTISMHGYN